MSEGIVGQLWSPISSGYESLKDALKLGLKDIVGSITYAFQLTFTYDKKKLEALIQNRRETLDKIAAEYSRRWSTFSKQMGPEFSTMMFFMAPGPYIAAYISSNSRADLGAVVKGLKDAGVPTNAFVKLFDLSGIDYPPSSKERGRDGDNGLDDDTRLAMASLYTRNTDGMQRSELERLLRNINSKVSDLYGLERRSASTSVREAVSNNHKTIRLDEGVYNDMLKSFNQVLTKHSKEFSATVEIDSKQLLNAKSQELEAYINTCESIDRFIKKIGEASTIEEIEEAYQYLRKNSPFEIDGMESGSPMNRIQNVVNANYSKVKNNPSLQKLIDASEINVKESGDSDGDVKESDAKKAILKIQIIKEIENAKKVVSSDKFKNSVEEIKAELYKSFMRDIDVKAIKYLDNDNNLRKLVSSAVKNLKPSSLP